MYELRVVSGFHRGVSLVIDEGPIVIGASLDADLVLTDPGIVENHVKIEPLTDYDDCWKLTCLNGGVTSEEGNETSEINISVNKMINLGGVWIQIMDKASPWPSKEAIHYNESSKPKVQEKTKAPALKIIVFFIVAFIGILTATHAAVSEKETDNEKSKKVSKATNKEPLKLTSNKVTRDTIKQEQETLAPVLRKMLAERGLTDIVLVASGDAWNLEGLVEPEDVAKFKRMLIRFSKKNPNSLTINNNVATRDYSLPFEIVKVVSGPYGHIEADDGYRLHLGGEHKGVTLVSITKSELVFSGKNNITVNW